MLSMTTPTTSDTSKSVKDEILQILMEYEGDVDSAMHPFINFIIAKDRYTKGVKTILNEWIGFKHYHHQYNLAQMFK
jgi:hypothetical protein